jgi:hypothetical protein
VRGGAAHAEADLQHHRRLAAEGLLVIQRRLLYWIRNFGPSSSSERACAVDRRPARVTKLRMRCSVGSYSMAALGRL